MSRENDSDLPPGDDRFLTTHWSLVIAAGRPQSPDSSQALRVLCETYWYPLYAFVRRQGHGAADAQDLTQGFFATLLEKNYVGDADQNRGRFRSFLLTSARHYLINQRDRRRAEKRGGGKAHVPLDFESAECRYRLEPADNMTPEKLFDRRWALTLLDRVLDRLDEEYAAAGKTDLFERLKDCLVPGKGGTHYRELAEQAGSSEGAVKVAVHRLRKRYRRVLEDEIAQTVADRSEIEAEIQQLFTALAAARPV
jgi:RNA polymerase sigma factor (sigma-70 family)